MRKSSGLEHDCGRSVVWESSDWSQGPALHLLSHSGALSKVLGTGAQGSHLEIEV